LATSKRVPELGETGEHLIGAAAEVDVHEYILSGFTFRARMALGER
jgi:hypothetical protein